MKTATITPRHLASVALMLLLGLVAILAPAAVDAHGHKSGHGKKPAFLSCQPLVNFQDAVKQVSDDTGIAPEMGSSFFDRLPIGKGSMFKHVPATRCALEWVNDSGNATAYGNCNGCTQGEWLSCAAIGLSKNDFNHTIPVAAEGDGGGPCASVSGPGFTVMTYTPPGIGSLGYVVAHVTGSDPNGKYPIDYNVYAWTKTKGCFVSFDAWPLSLAASEAYVDKAVRTALKPKSQCSG